MSIFNSFKFSHLTFLHRLGKNTDLVIYEPEKKLYTVKSFSPEYINDYRKIASLDSPYLSKIIYIDERTSCYVCEYVSGDCLKNILDEYKTVTEDRARKIISEVCRGLAVLHNAGIVHRDINPNNIIITPDGTAKIIDYGIIRNYNDIKNADTVILGTPGYAAPEQFGFTQSDNRTDIYAAGVLLNVMLTGRLPNERIYGGRTGEIIKRCTMIDAKKRYNSISDLADVLSDGYMRHAPVIKRLLSGLPGFRSGNATSAIIAGILYISAFIFMLYILFSDTLTWKNFFMRIIFLAFHIIIPYILFFDVCDVCDNLPGADRKSKRTVGRFIGILSVILNYVVLVLLYGQY